MSWPNVVVLLGIVYAVTIVCVTALVAGNWANVAKTRSDNSLNVKRDEAEQ